MQRNLNFTQKIIDWLSRMAKEKRGGRIRRVSDKEARRRADICAQCPKQAGIALTCAKCSDDMAKLRKAILDGKEPVHKGVAACSIFDDDLQVVVHLETGTAPNIDIPNFCWRKQK